jgi:hypothetical protein
MNGMFLTAEEIRELTGYQRYADQRTWLTNHGWRFEVNAAGRPIVLRSFAEKRLGDEHSGKKSAVPDFSVISKAA